MACHTPFLECERGRLSKYHCRSKKKSNGTAVLYGYGIAYDYERYHQDDDDKRSRSIPSRTKLGKRASIIEKYPTLGAPLVLLGGLITMPLWGYRNLSIAYTDIMMADCPRVAYNEPKVTKKDIDDAKKRTEELRDKTKKNGLGISLKNLVNPKSFVNSKIKG